MGKKAALIGATGATGQHLLVNLCDSGVYDCVQAFGRKRVAPVERTGAAGDAAPQFDLIRLEAAAHSAVTGSRA